MTASHPVSTVPVSPLRDPQAPPDTRGLGGLLAMVEGAPQALPLQQVTVRASIAGVVARTVVTQTFSNALEHPVEAVHIFPLPERGAVIALELVAGDVVVTAECRERREAEQIFDDARRAGHQAALLTAERDDVHTLRVTRLPPGETVEVRIVVVENLHVVDGLVRWRFPTVIAPRFMPGEPIGHAGPGVHPDTTSVPDASRIQPPVRLQGGTSLDLQVQVAGPVSSVACTQHAVQLQLDRGDIVVSPRADSICDRDFVLAFGMADPAGVSTVAWTDGVHTLAMVAPPSAAMAPTLGRDAIFVVDVSGSMRGRKMDAARRALKTALHGLLPGDRFRLIAFDDRVSPATPDLVPYTEAEVERADRWIDALDDRGGTQMLAPILEALTGGTPTSADRLRTVLFITDGQAGDESAVTRAVARNVGRARFFTLGIDTAVNGALLERLARVGGGTCELLTPSEDIEAAVAKLEARFGSPLIEGIDVAEGETAAQRRHAVFAGRPAAVLVCGSVERVLLSGRGVEGAWSAEVVPRRVDFDFGALWARRRIATYEDELAADGGGASRVQATITELALKHQLATRWTAFVAVARTRQVSGELVEVVQPVSAPDAWDMPMAGECGAAPPAPMMSMAVAPPAPGGPAPRRARKAKSRAAPAPTLKKSAVAPPKGGMFDKLARGLGFGGASSPRADLDDDFAGAMEEAEAPAPVAEAAVPSDVSRIGAYLAQAQGFDGGFGSVGRTAAALLALIWLGHTRRTGVRQRTVLKAATWLASNASGDPLAASVLAALGQAESGERPAWDASWDALLSQGAEGRSLALIAGTGSPSPTQS